jgi:hypothetical protein
MFQFIETPKYVGYWIIGGSMGMKVAQTRKPRWLTRALCSLLLQWEWRDGSL